MEAFDSAENNRLMLEDVPGDLRWRLDGESAFHAPPEWASSDAMPERPKPTAPSTTTIDLSKYYSPGGQKKYTCPMCHYRYTTRDVRFWWRKPDNPGGKPAIPSCPNCGLCGYLRGWHEDMNDWKPDEPLDLTRFLNMPTTRRGRRR